MKIFERLFRESGFAPGWHRRVRQVTGCPEEEAPAEGHIVVDDSAKCFNWRPEGIGEPLPQPVAPAPAPEPAATPASAPQEAN